MLSFYASSIIGGAMVALAATVRRKADWLTDAIIATFFGAYPLLFGLAMALDERVRYHTYDGLLYRIDLGLRLDPFSWIQFVALHRWFYVSLMTAYMALPIVLALAWIIDRSVLMLRAVSIAPVFAMVVYNLVPGVGPVHAFSATHTLLPLDLVAHSPRNAFPSMHLTWVLLIALNAKKLEWRIATSLFVVLTTMATVCSGEHYYIDLIAAIPFALGVQYLAQSCARFPKESVKCPTTTRGTRNRLPFGAISARG